MSSSDKRRLLIEEILGDDVEVSEEYEMLHVLLREHVSQNAVSEHENALTFGQKAADGLAKFAGSWTFIGIFFLILVLWIVSNAVLLARPYDVYPFILLNLILSCLAAIQAPIIMMSQNRQEEKDRARAKNDYKVNLKAEIIIEEIHHQLSALRETQQAIYEKLQALDSGK